MGDLAATAAIAEAETLAGGAVEVEVAVAVAVAVAVVPLEGGRPRSRRPTSGQRAAPTA